MFNIYFPGEGGTNVCDPDFSTSTLVSVRTLSEDPAEHTRSCHWLASGTVVTAHTHPDTGQCQEFQQGGA